MDIHMFFKFGANAEDVSALPPILAFKVFVV
jgi:hypothetical protein